MENNYPKTPRDITPVSLEATEGFSPSIAEGDITPSGNAPSASKISGFSVVRALGAGSMGVVLLVEKDKRRFAMKLARKIDSGRNDSSDEIQRFIREAQILSSIHHPNVVEIVEYGISPPTNDGVPFLVMEFVSGYPLNTFPDLEKKTQDWKISIVRQVASALEAVHSHGIVHRDVKPGNILVSNDGTAKLDDFGVAEIAESNSRTMLDALGSPAYMAPEAFDHGKTKDHRSDIFSLGIVAYELITGIKPFHGTNLDEIKSAIKNNDPIAPVLLEPSLPLGVQNTLAGMLAKAPSDRFQSMSDVLKALSPPYNAPSTAKAKQVWRRER